MNPERPTPRDIIKMPKVKDKEKMFKAARETQSVTYRGAPIRSTDFSTETLHTRRDWHKIFKVMKNKKLQPRSLYKAKLSFRIKGKVKSIPDKKKKTKG